MRPQAYSRFIVLAAGRTGSTMLVRALNSSPYVRCFGEVFNADVDFLPFGVEGYDDFSREERALRDRDYGAFLEERIFCQPPGAVRAVGFKLLYRQNWAFPGLLERLIDDKDLRVIHLRRQNRLRTLASWKMAQVTGVYVEQQGGARRTLTLSNAAGAARHPVRAARALGRRMRLFTIPSAKEPLRVAPSIQQAAFMFKFLRDHEAHYEGLFREHASHAVFYEELVGRQGDAFARVQSFLGVEPIDLTVSTRRQNPRPLPEILENYEELREAFKDTQDAQFFGVSGPP